MSNQENLLSQKALLLTRQIRAYQAQIEACEAGDPKEALRHNNIAYESLFQLAQIEEDESKRTEIRGRMIRLAETSETYERLIFGGANSN